MPDSAIVYPLLGRAQDSLDHSSKHYNVSEPVYLGAQYDASTTNLSYSIPSPHGRHADAANLTISFLSPITPTSTLRQSLPASYISVHVKGNFDVHVYIDVNGQWVSGDRGSQIVWSFAQDDGEQDGTALQTFSVKRRDELLFTEHGDQAEWGELHFTAPLGIKYEAGVSGDLRRYFAKKGTLTDRVDTHFRGIMDEEPVFAFTKAFHLNSNSSHYNESSAKEGSVVFTIAHVQDPVTQFASGRGLTWMRPLWKSYFFTASSLVAYHYNDYHHASQLAANYSAQVAKDAFASGSDDYKDIVELSARQVLGATSFSGTPDNPLIFLKEISSNGNCQTIDVIFPAFPFFLYTNPRWLAYLLEPLIEHMLSGQYPNQYAMHDLGAHFPNLTGHPLGRDEYMPVEECGNILIMGLAIVNSLSHGDGWSANSMWSALGTAKDAAATERLADGVTPFALPDALEIRDGIHGLDDQWGGVTAKHQARKWVSRSYRLWKQWTGYLVEFSLLPENQLCTDDFAGWLELQTNLALKGIIGIKAMSELAQVVGERGDAKYYRNISEVYIKDWEGYAMSPDGGRAKLAYHWQGSWTTLYSLFADAVLCFHPNGNFSEDSTRLLVGGDDQLPILQQEATTSRSKNFIPNHIYTTQSRWYANAMQKYGLPLDSRHLYTKSDWEFQVAAVASRKTRKEILARVARWVNETATDRPLTDLYKTEEDGGFPGNRFTARPVVGSHFAFLTLERVCGGRAAGVFEYEE